MSGGRTIEKVAVPGYLPVCAELPAMIVLWSIGSWRMGLAGLSARVATPGSHRFLTCIIRLPILVMGAPTLWTLSASRSGSHGPEFIMILGLSLSAFTTVHVVLSLIGIAAGLVVVAGIVVDRHLPGLTALFLTTTVLTSVTGFFFPSAGLLASHIVGIVSLTVLAVALFAIYGRHLSGAWRPVYVVTAIMALYLNVFVGIVQAFQKLPALRTVAPTQSEPPFLAVQLIALLACLVAGGLALKRFHPQTRP